MKYILEVFQHKWNTFLHFALNCRHFHQPETPTYVGSHPLSRPWRVFLSPSPRRRVIWYREGDFVRGGRFCTTPQVVPGTTPTVPPSKDEYTLQSEQKHRTQTPLNGTGGRSGTGRVIFSVPEGDLATLSAPEGDFVRGGRFCTPSPAAPGTTPTVSPSRDISTLLGRFHPPE